MLTATGPLGQFPHEFVGQIHEVSVVGIGLIELQHGEFWIVPSGQTLVTKIAVDFINALEASDHQTLQEQLWGHTQKQWHIQRIVVSGKRPRCGPSRDAMHHGGFYLQIAALIEKVTKGLHHHGARAEHAPRVFVHDQVNVTLAIPYLLIGHAMKFLRQWQHGLVQQHNVVRVNA